MRSHNSLRVYNGKSARSGKNWGSEIFVQKSVPWWYVFMARIDVTYGGDQCLTGGLSSKKIYNIRRATSFFRGGGRLVAVGRVR